MNIYTAAGLKDGQGDKGLLLPYLLLHSLIPTTSSSFSVSVVSCRSFGPLPSLLHLSGLLLRQVVIFPGPRRQDRGFDAAPGQQAPLSPAPAEIY